jgi:hypothetical protein
MTPEAIMAAFAERGPLPRAALEAAGRSREAMVPIFLDHLAQLARADPETGADDPAFIFVYHLLAEWRVTEAYRPLIRLLRRDPAFVDALMDDGITECGARVVVSVFDGDLEPIIETALDPDAEEFVRGQMLDALAMLALRAAPLRPAVEDFLRRFPTLADDRTPDIVWCSWSTAVAALGLTDMTEAVREVYEGGLIDPLIADFAGFKADLARSGQPNWSFLRGPITDTIAELSTWHCFSEAYLEAEAPAQQRLAAEAAVSARGPKVGRNDPCPCGSGKKYKKCCLQ